MMTSADEARIGYTLGCMVQPGLAQGYPDLVRMLNRIYTDKVVKLPWVPADWLEAVQAVQRQNPNDLIKPAPGVDALNRRGGSAPSFADTDAKITAWHTLYTTVQSAIVAYAAKQSEIGASKLNALYADAAFWNAAYVLADFAKNLPAKLVGGIASGVVDFVGTFLPESLKAYAKWITWGLVLLIVGGLVLWYRKKLGALVRGLKGKP